MAKGECEMVLSASYSIALRALELPPLSVHKITKQKDIIENGG